MDQKKIQEKRYLSVPEAAAYIGIAKGTLYNGIAPNSPNPFPVPVKRIGKIVRFDRLEIEKYMGEC